MPGPMRIVQVDADTRRELQLLLGDELMRLTEGNQLDRQEAEWAPAPDQDWGGWEELRNRLALAQHFGSVLEQIGWPTGGSLEGGWKDSETPSEGCSIRLDASARRVIEFVRTRLQSAADDQDDDAHREPYRNDLSLLDRVRADGGGDAS